jgi:hypothetical protein
MVISTIVSRSGSHYLLGALACATIALTGCGSSNSSGKALTHAQLVSQADSLCSATNAHIAKLTVPNDLQGLAGYASSTRAATSQLQQSLSALHPPKADEAAVARYLTALKQGDAILAQISSAAAAGEKGTVKSLGSKLSATKAGALADAAGLSACAAAS